jgi:hypothetical protein
MTGNVEDRIIAYLTGERSMGKRTWYPTKSDVARRAYQLYEARGRQDGRDIEDWLRAEQELGL